MGRELTARACPPQQHEGVTTSALVQMLPKLSGVSDPAANMRVLQPVSFLAFTVSRKVLCSFFACLSQSCHDPRGLRLYNRFCV